MAKYKSWLWISVMTVIRPMRYGVASWKSTNITSNPVPCRALYRPEDLGPSPCMIGDLPYIRQDIQLTNAGGYTLECSWWKPYNKWVDPLLDQQSKFNEMYREVTKIPMPCIVVLHGNSSCRLGCMDMMFHALTSGFTVFAFDFCGSGLSQVCLLAWGF